MKNLFLVAGLCAVGVVLYRNMQNASAQAGADTSQSFSGGITNAASVNQDGPSPPITGGGVNMSTAPIVVSADGGSPKMPVEMVGPKSWADHPLSFA